MGRAGVATAAGTFRKDVPMVLPIAAELARCANALLELGVLRAVPRGAKRPDQDEPQEGVRRP
jgi:hypothetical protein